jgi:integrase
LRALAAGVDPGESKKRAKVVAEQAEADRAGDTIEHQVKLHLERQSRRVVESTWRQARLALEGDAVRAWRGRLVGEIKRRDVVALVEKIAETRGPIAGNRAFQHLRRFFTALLERDVISVSPVHGVKKPAAEHARERVLGPGEIRELWLALDRVSGPAAAAVKVLLLTGARRSEVSGMRRSELGDDVWTLPPLRVKNRRSHSVPLSDQVKDLLARQPVRGDFVFSHDGSRPIDDFSRLKLAVDAIVKFEAQWCWHDLRRTAASGMQKLGVRAEVIERALNHASGVYRSVAGIYQRDPLTEEVRDALRRWGDFVEHTVKGEAEPGKVVTLRRR